MFYIFDQNQKVFKLFFKASKLYIFLNCEVMPKDKKK